ncbi:MAG: glutamine-hydrolyzing GMP synthase [Fidelibacterota bacterium]
MKLHQGGVIVLDFGSQYTQLIARRIREQHVHSEILPHNVDLDDIQSRNPKALILSGGPSSVYHGSAPVCDPRIFELDIPILGICYGLQLLADYFGGEVTTKEGGEYGLSTVLVQDHDLFFHDVPANISVWMSHRDQVTKLPGGWTVLARSANNIIAAIAEPRSRRYATQFHPEVSHTEAGVTMLRNFLFHIAGCEPSWTAGHFITDKVRTLKQRLGNQSVLCGVSGGVDSTVVAALLHRAVGEQVIAVFIDHGLLRSGEARQVVATLEAALKFPVKMVDHSELFLEKLKGITDPEEKRKRIGEQFIRSFELVAETLGGIQYLAQGTLYPDVIESGTAHKGGPAAVIKSHHNVGGLPTDMAFTLVEPLKELFKDEVRQVGRELGLPEALLQRHPFPGPGLAVRILGEVTEERLTILRRADELFIDTLHQEDLYDDIWQAFAVLVPLKTVGVMGDQRTYGYLLALRAVTSRDGMTADWYRMPPEVLSRISNRIVNNVQGINRVVYDVTSKPPGTIEWE